MESRLESSIEKARRSEELQKDANDEGKKGEVEEGEQGARAYRNLFLHRFEARLRNTSASVTDEGGGISVRPMWRYTRKEVLSFECQCLCLSAIASRETVLTGVASRARLSSPQLPVKNCKIFTPSSFINIYLQVQINFTLDI